MIAALLTILFLGGGGSATGFIADLDSVQKQVAQTVPDDNAMRRGEAVAIVKDMKSRNKDFGKVLAKLADEMDKSIADQNQSEGSVANIWDAFSNTVEAQEDVMIEQRFQLKSKLTREEWATIFPEAPGS